MKHWAYIGGGAFVLIAAVVGIFSLAFGNGGIDYDDADSQERIAWMERQAETLASDFSSGLEKAGVKPHQISVKETTVNIDEKRIILFAEAKNNLVLITPPNFRMDFLEDMCPAYRRSGLHPHDIAVTFKLQRVNGDGIRSDTVSRTVCRQMREFKKRAGA